LGRTRSEGANFSFKFTKPLVFGLIIATIGCYHGLRVKGGTAGVGATITAFVSSSLVVLIVDSFITKLSLYVFNL
jgi:phospholipid/cholesterol/gamma-HCH transport system permease protein